RLLVKFGPIKLIAKGLPLICRHRDLGGKFDLARLFDHVAHLYRHACRLINSGISHGSITRPASPVSGFRSPSPLPIDAPLSSDMALEYRSSSGVSNSRPWASAASLFSALPSAIPGHRASLSAAAVGPRIAPECPLVSASACSTGAIPSAPLPRFPAATAPSPSASCPLAPPAV